EQEEMKKEQEEMKKGREEIKTEIQSHVESQVGLRLSANEILRFYLQIYHMQI
ncbi:hypothetical protein AVEN_223235-1, partial [Araneus ventricosus]